MSIRQNILYIDSLLYYTVKNLNDKGLKALIKKYKIKKIYIMEN